MRFFASLLALITCLITACPAAAHEVRPAYLELSETEPQTFDITWKQPVLDGRRLRLTPQLPETCTQTRPQKQELAPGAIITRWQMRCSLETGTISVAGLDRTLTDVFLRVSYLNGDSKSGLLRAAAPSLSLGDASTASPALAYFRIGVDHIVFGWDHLLFVFGVVLLVKLRQLLWTLTAFTIGHSLTLGAAALGFASLPGPPIEILIALSITFLAAEALWRAQGRETLAGRYPALIAGGFGLIHGFGFAGALADIGLPKSQELTALLLFNLGVEAGQIAVVIALLALGWIIAKARDAALPPARTLAAYAIGITGAYWAIERIVGVVTGA